MSLAETSQFVRSQAGLEPGIPGAWFQFAVRLKPDGQLIGDCALFVDPKDAGSGEIGFTLSRTHQGRGFAGEAVTAVLGFAFEILELRHVRAVVDSRNEAAIRLLERLGLRREGLERSWFKGAWCDEYVYGVVAGDCRRGHRFRCAP